MAQLQVSGSGASTSLTASDTAVVPADDAKLHGITITAAGAATVKVTQSGGWTRITTSAAVTVALGS